MALLCSRSCQSTAEGRPSPYRAGHATRTMDRLQHPSFFIARLSSGHSQPGHLQQAVNEINITNGMALDVMHDSPACDASEPHVFCKILHQLCQKGLFLGAICNLPSDTWSTAAEQMSPDPPRTSHALRRASQLWGLRELSSRQCSELALSNRVLQRSSLVLFAVWLAGGGRPLGTPGPSEHRLTLDPASDSAMAADAGRASAPHTQV